MLLPDVLGYGVGVEMRWEKYTKWTALLIFCATLFGCMGSREVERANTRVIEMISRVDSLEMELARCSGRH